VLQSASKCAASSTLLRVGGEALPDPVATPAQGVRFEACLCCPRMALKQKAPLMKHELLALLAPIEQQQVLAFWDRLSPDQQQSLAEQIRELDLDLVHSLVHTHVLPRNAPQGGSPAPLSTSGGVARTLPAEPPASLAERAVGPPAIRLNGAGASYPVDEARRTGIQAWSSGQLGVLLVAGGQGTRLGFDHPKGMYPIGPVSGCSLFQILCEKVLAAQRRYDVTLPLYIMTSRATHDETCAFLAQHGYFGLAPSQVTLFRQGSLPAVDAQTGRLLLESPSSLALAPDGHGGLLRALRSQGVLQDMQNRGLTRLFYMQVDNPLATVGEPLFAGWHLLEQSELSTQVVAKQAPDERVGNVVEVDGRVQIIEYSDLPAEAAARRHPDGSLVLWAGNIAVHLFELPLLAQFSTADCTLPFHVARKKVPYIDESGYRVQPERENACKFEQFIFDLLPHARRALVVEVDAEQAFAPLKNAPGAPRDAPEHVQARMIRLHRRWLEAAAVRVAPGVKVEISPLAALAPDDLAGRLPQNWQIEADTYIYAAADGSLAWRGAK
jgi:UDP-N-acetylglucosamine/UDP-N-acetylgalactosamine diphosphorylase